MRLGIDLDGVVADFNSGWISNYVAQFGGHIPEDALIEWNGIPSLTHFEDMAEFWDWARDLNGATVFRHLEPYPGALEALAELDGRGHDIVVITTKPHWAISDTYAWLAEHRIPAPEVHITEDKASVQRCDVYLDDGPHNLEALIARWRGVATVVRFVRPWNRPVAGVVDVTGWGEFLSLVE